MRSSRYIVSALALSVVACKPTARICSPVESWSSPAYTCHMPPPPVVEAPAPPPTPTPTPPPEPPKAQVKAEKIELSEIVQFQTDSSVLRDDSKPVLNAVVDIMKNHPEIEKVRIEGYTDNTGSAAHNLGLSKDRAKSVKEYLVGQGVDGKRLDTEGFGETKPVADNATDDGRYKNRRVDFVIVKRKE